MSCSSAGWEGHGVAAEQAPKGTVRAGATCPVALSISVSCFPSPGSPKGVGSQLWLVCDVEIGGVFASGMGVPLPTGGVQDLPNCLPHLTWPGHPQQRGANATPGPSGSATLCLACLRWLCPVPVSHRCFVTLADSAPAPSWRSFVSPACNPC